MATIRLRCQSVNWEELYDALFELANKDPGFARLSEPEASEKKGALFIEFEALVGYIATLPETKPDFRIALGSYWGTPVIEIYPRQAEVTLADVCSARIKRANSASLGSLLWAISIWPGEFGGWVICDKKGSAKDWYDEKYAQYIQRLEVREKEEEERAREAEESLAREG